MAVGRSTAVLLALAVASAVAQPQPPAPAAVAGNTTAVAPIATDGHGVTDASHHDSLDESDKKDELVLASGLASVKALVDIALAFLSATIQVKGFGLAVINTVVNVGRFLIELHAARSRLPGSSPPLSYSFSTYF